MLNETFSTDEVLRLTGATARQLQWWDERQLVAPLRDGRRRIYSRNDLVDILVILQLRQRHISLQQVRKILKFLRLELRSRFADLVRDGAEHHLLLDGKRIYLETDTEQIIDLLRNTKQPVFVICLTDTVKRLRIQPPATSLPIRKSATRVRTLQRMREAI